LRLLSGLWLGSRTGLPRHHTWVTVLSSLERPRNEVRYPRNPFDPGTSLFVDGSSVDRIRMLIVGYVFAIRSERHSADQGKNGRLSKAFAECAGLSAPANRGPESPARDIPRIATQNLCCYASRDPEPNVKAPQTRRFSLSIAERSAPTRLNGGAHSLPRTRLCVQFPDKQGIYREFFDFWAS